MDTLLILVVVVAGGTVVGDGIWGLLGWVFGPPRGTEANEGGSRPHSEDGVGCGATVFPGHKRCRWCGLDPHGRAATELKDLLAAAREIAVFREQAALDADTLNRIQTCIDSRRQDLLDAQSPQVSKATLP